MNISEVKMLGAQRFMCEPEDIEVTVNGRDGLVEIAQISSGYAVYYFLEDFDD